MGLGGTAKRIQALAERAEQLYEQLVALRERTVQLEESVDESTARIHRLEVEAEKQRVLLRAIAEERGIDVDRVLAEAAIEEAEPAEDDGDSEDADDGDSEDADDGDSEDADDEGGSADGAVDAAPETDADGTADGPPYAGDAGDTDAVDGEPTVIDDSGEPVE